MKATLHKRYAPPDELLLKEIDELIPEENEVLIKIHTSTVTTSDSTAYNFTFVPKLFLLPTKLSLGTSKPRTNILGIDFAREIVAVGKDVRRLKRVTRAPELPIRLWGPCPILVHPG